MLRLRGSCGGSHVSDALPQNDSLEPVSMGCGAGTRLRYLRGRLKTQVVFAGERLRGQNIISSSRRNWFRLDSEAELLPLEYISPTRSEFLDALLEISHLPNGQIRMRGIRRCSGTLLAEAEFGVHHGLDDFGEHVEHDQQCCVKQRAADDEHGVAIDRGLDEKPAQARDAENGFHDE